MPLLKSDKARQELASRQRALTVRERSALFLANGIRSRDELVYLLQGDIGMLQKLMANGYLIPSETVGAKASRMTDFAVAAAPQIEVLAPRATAPAPVQSADSFDGKRSLATTRMFLFDIVERMFVRKMPELADHLREQLREARDRPSMLVIAREIILNVEEIAGPDRADGLSERLAMMLPPES